MEKISVIIIDDEAPARNIIASYIKSYDNLDIIAECSNGFEGLKAINLHNPKLVFLDIQMPKINGFELLEILDNKPAIIFTTAYDKYAVKAFEHNAVDYLLKPFSKERFKVSVENAIRKIGTIDKNSKYFDNLVKEAISEKLKRVVVKKDSEIHVLSLDSIYYFEAQDDYVMIYTKTRKYLKQQTMKFYESHLNDKDFVRIHRSYIVNVSEILKIEPFEKDSYIVVMKNQERIRASRAGYKNLKEILDI